jgi:hypothetical protein
LQHCIRRLEFGAAMKLFTRFLHHICYGTASWTLRFYRTVELPIA